MTDNKEKVWLIDMDKKDFSAELFNRLSYIDKIQSVEFVSSNEHKIILDMELI